MNQVACTGEKETAWGHSVAIGHDARCSLPLGGTGRDGCRVTRG